MGNPWPDRLRLPGLSADGAPYDGANSLPDVGPKPGNLGPVGRPRRAPVAGRRALLQSRAAAGLRPRLHDGRRRLPQRRRPAQLRLSAIQHVASVPAADLRPGRRHARRSKATSGNSRASATSRASRCRSANSPCRTSSTTTPTPAIPRVDFLNLSIWASGAFDYPADSVGFTWGVTAELNQPNWSARLGYFLVPRVSDNDAYDLALVCAAAAMSASSSCAITPYDRPGAVRFGAWLNSAIAGSYNDAVALAAHNPGLTANDTMPWTRRAASSTALSQPRARAQRRCRRLRALQLERRPHRDHVLHRHRYQPVGRPVDQGRVVGAAQRHDRHRAARSTTSRATMPTSWRLAGSASRSATARSPTPRRSWARPTIPCGLPRASSSPPTISSWPIPPTTPCAGRCTSSADACWQVLGDPCPHAGARRERHGDTADQPSVVPRA